MEMDSRQREMRWEIGKYRELKKEYLKNMDSQIFIQLIKCLQKEGVFCLYDWDLTDEEKYLFEEADTLHIETEMRPALFFDEEENILTLIRSIRNTGKIHFCF